MLGAERLGAERLRGERKTMSELMDIIKRNNCEFCIDCSTKNYCQDLKKYEQEILDWHKRKLFEIEKVYEKYKHLEKFFCIEIISTSFEYRVILDLWTAIKSDIR